MNDALISVFLSARIIFLHAILNFHRLQHLFLFLSNRSNVLNFFRLLSNLENRLQESLILSDVCDILCDHFQTNFDPYVKYCSNQVYQDRTLRKLKLVISCK